MGTPSAPPILDIGREGSDMEVEEETEQIQDGIYKSVQADHFDGNKEGLADSKSRSFNCAELGEERCCSLQFHYAQFTWKPVMKNLFLLSFWF